MTKRDIYTLLADLMTYTNHDDDCHPRCDVVVKPCECGLWELKAVAEAILRRKKDLEPPKQREKPKKRDQRAEKFSK